MKLKDNTNVLVALCFGVIGLWLVLPPAEAFRPLPCFEIVQAGDALVDLHTQVPATLGLCVPMNGYVHSRTQPVAITFVDTQVFMAPYADVRVKHIDNESIQLFSSRGRVDVSPDRSLTYCTRQVCIESEGGFHVNYVTPGEVVEIQTDAQARVRAFDRVYDMVSGDVLRVDELSRLITTTP